MGAEEDDHPTIIVVREAARRQKNQENPILDQEEDPTAGLAAILRDQRELTKTEPSSITFRLSEMFTTAQEMIGASWATATGAEETESQANPYFSAGDLTHSDQSSRGLGTGRAKDKEKHSTRSGISARRKMNTSNSTLVSSVKDSPRTTKRPNTETKTTEYGNSAHSDKSSIQSSSNPREMGERHRAARASDAADEGDHAVVTPCEVNRSYNYRTPSYP